MERLSLAEFVRTNQPKFAPNFRAAGYPSVNLSISEIQTKWENLHTWCRDAFQDRYSWTGSLFWFEKTEDAHLFKCLWVWGLGELMERFPFAIRVITPEYTSHYDTDECFAVAELLRQRFNVQIVPGSTDIGRWIGLSSERDAMYARLMLPNNVFVDLRELKRHALRSD